MLFPVWPGRLSFLILTIAGLCRLQELVSVQPVCCVEAPLLPPTVSLGRPGGPGVTLTRCWWRTE